VVVVVVDVVVVVVVAHKGFMNKWIIDKLLRCVEYNKN
jgi:hypothetical protein